MRGENGIDQRDAVLQRLVQVAVGEDATDEGVAVGVGAAAGQAEELVAGLHLVGAGQEGVLVDQADDGTGDVAGAGCIDAGHFGGFAAQEGTAGGAAGFGHAKDDGGDVFGHEFVGGDIVEEEERSRALHEDVVEAVVDDVAADGLPAAVLGGELDFGADAVGGGDEQGLGGQVGEGEEAAEATDVGADVGGECRAHGLTS